MSDLARAATKLAKMLPLAAMLYDAFGGDTRKARAAIRRWEQEQRKITDRRLSRPR